MNKKRTLYYFNSIEVDVSCASIFSKKADVCIVPQYSRGVALNGASSSIIHSRAQDGILAYQDFLKKHKELPLGEVFMTDCSGEHYRHLLQISVLDCPAEKTVLTVTTAIKNALKKADETGAKTVVMPEINTAAYSKEVSQAIITAIKELAPHLQSLQKITLLCRSKESFQNNRHALNKMKSP